MFGNPREKNVLGIIKSSFETFTSVEKTIAEFFIGLPSIENLSAKSVSACLHVSEASLSRFAQKCGCKGYREFLYQYKNDYLSYPHKINVLTKNVLETYQELLNKTIELVNEPQMHRIASLISNTPKVFIYGTGSSGVAALEFKMRFMRLGMPVETITDAHVMRMNSAIVDKNSFVIGVSVSGKTGETLNALCLAKNRGAKTLLITANHGGDLHTYCDEVLKIASIENLEKGNRITPQFPILVMGDIFYAYYLETDYYRKSELHNSTLSVLYDQINKPETTV
ncbi:MurR/RpiR family transcriptional regulator [Oscillospiraceae bacterium PP1C4]